MDLTTEYAIEEMAFKVDTTLDAAQMNLNLSKDHMKETKPATVAADPNLKPKPTTPDKTLSWVRFVHTMGDWRTTPVPTTLFMKPKEILREDPRAPLMTPEKDFVCETKDDRITSRPKKLLSPALNIDDMPPVPRALVIKDIYTTTYAAACQPQAKPRSNILSPLPGFMAPADPLAHPKPKPPYISPEWRMETVTFDARQARHFCDPTKDFWLKSNSGDTEPQPSVTS